MKKTLIALLSVAASLIGACTDKIIHDEVPYAQQILVTSYFQTYLTYDTTYFSYGTVNVPIFDRLPDVSMNGIPGNFSGGTAFYFDGLSLAPGTPCSLGVEVGDKHLSGTVSIPGPSRIIEPAEDQLLTNRDLTVRWSDGKAAFYNLTIYYSYDDSAGFYRSFDTIVKSITDTVKVMTNFLPDFSHGGVWFSGFVGVTAVNGPSFAAGTPGNLSGDGSGFLWTYYSGFGNYFDFSLPSRTFKKDMQEKFIRDVSDDIRRSMRLDRTMEVPNGL